MPSHTPEMKALPLFRELTDFELEHIFSLCSRGAPFAAGEVIVKEGEPGSDIYYLPRGTIRIELSAGHPVPVVLGELHGPTTFGEVSFLDHGPRTATVKAAEPLELLRVDGPKLEALLAEMPHTAHKLMRNIALLVAHTLRGNLEGCYSEMMKAHVVAQGRAAVAKYRESELLNIRV